MVNELWSNDYVDIIAKRVYEFDPFFVELIPNEIVLDVLKEVLEIAKTKVGKKEAKYQDIVNYKHQLIINEKLMNLIQPNIPDQDKEFLNTLVSEYRETFEPSAFIKLYNEDNLGGSISNVPVWLNETFSKLIKYK